MVRELANADSRVRAPEFARRPSPPVRQHLPRPVQPHDPFLLGNRQRAGDLGAFAAPQHAQLDRVAQGVRQGGDIGQHVMQPLALFGRVVRPRLRSGELPHRAVVAVIAEARIQAVEARALTHQIDDLVLEDADQPAAQRAARCARRTARVRRPPPRRRRAPSLRQARGPAAGAARTAPGSPRWSTNAGHGTASDDRPQEWRQRCVEHLASWQLSVRGALRLGGYAVFAWPCTGITENHSRITSV